jgi:hypothetical protein
MKKLILAAAICVALPAVAQAQETTEEGKMACCEKMSDGEGCDCCKHEEDHAEGSTGDSSTHSGH